MLAVSHSSLYCQKQPLDCLQLEPLDCLQLDEFNKQTREIAKGVKLLLDYIF